MTTSTRLAEASELTGLWYARPVSATIIGLLGGLGEHVYYISFTMIVLLNLVFTHIFVTEVTGPKTNSFEQAAMIFIGSLLWFSLSSSTQSVQYLGLMTNATSYLFGITAAILLMNLARPPSIRVAKLVVFAVLVGAAAFAKEDMGPFLCCVCAFAALERYRYGTTAIGSVKFMIVSMLLVLLWCGASLLHSIYVGSPFVNGTGPYSLTNAPSNALDNFVFYTCGVSQATCIVYGSFAAGICALLVAGALLPQLRLAGVASGAIGISSLALMLPYLVLPRKFDFYAMTSFPILGFGLTPLLIVAVDALVARREVRWIRWAIIWTCAVGVVYLNRIDQEIRDQNLKWLATVRSELRRQIDELDRSVDFGIQGCSKVGVQGVNGLGPFLTTSASYLNEHTNAPIQWEIVTPSKSLLELWSGQRPFPPNLSYVRSVANVTAGCRLIFDPATLRATMRLQ